MTFYWCIIDDYSYIVMPSQMEDVEDDIQLQHFIIY